MNNMPPFLQIVLLTMLIMAQAVLLSCTDAAERDNSYDEKASNYIGEQSSSSLRSSSSFERSSSSVGSSSVISYGSISYQGKSYKTVKIGSQNWMAENLNYNASGSKCGTENGELKDNDTEYCDMYGRLYDWATAMALPASCNSSLCISQTSAKHRGVCPSGWHIPTGAEWEALYRFVDSASGTAESPYGSQTAGRYLKATDGWNSYSGIVNEDTWGFAALPGGSGGLDDYYGLHRFGGSGKYGNWWGSTEDAWVFSWVGGCLMDYARESISGGGGDKQSLYSVRCVEDDGSSSFIVYGDKGNNISSYRTVQIGTQTWMAENLNYAVAGGKCLGEGGRYWNGEGYIFLSVGEVQANCDKYGRLYDWATAMVLPSYCNLSTCASQVSAKHQGICPSGWHIPTNAEWVALYRFVDSVSGTAESPDLTAGPYTSLTAGWYLKATDGWHDNGNGTDSYGFAALPGGGGNFQDNCNCYTFAGSALGYFGWWWSSTEDYFDYVDHVFNAFSSHMSCEFDDVSVGGANHKTDLQSVRCVRND